MKIQILFAFLFYENAITCVDKAAEITIGDAEDHKSEKKKKEKRKLDQEVEVHDKVVDDGANADSSKKKMKSENKDAE